MSSVKDRERVFSKDTYVFFYFFPVLFTQKCHLLVIPELDLMMSLKY